MLISHPHRALAHFFLHGITTGFWIGYNLPSTALKSAKKNVTSAYDHTAVVTDYLAAELAEGCIVGPFPPFMPILAGSALSQSPTNPISGD